MRYCNICILIHDKKPDLEIIPTFLKKLENLDFTPKIIYTIADTNQKIDYDQYLTNVSEHRQIKVKQDIIRNLSEEYDNDLPLFYLESNYNLLGDFKKSDLNAIDKPIYIEEIYDKYSYSKLFYLPYYLIKNDENIKIVRFEKLENSEVLDNFTNYNNFNRDEIINYIEKYVSDKIIELFQETLKPINKITSLNITEYIKEEYCKSKRWLVNYFFGLSYYHCENYKKAKEYFKNCNSLIPFKIESNYFLAKIEFLNEKYKNCYNILLSLGKNNSEYMFMNNEICNFHIEYLKILVNLKLDNIQDSIDIANKLIDAESCSRQYRRIILHYISKLQDSKDINEKKIDNNSKFRESITKLTALEYDNTTHFKIINNDNCLDLKKEKDKLNIYIDDINRNITYENDSIFSCLNHKNSTVLVVNSLSPLIINSLKDNSVVKLLEYQTPTYLKNYTFVSKFEKYKNVYVALITFKDEFCKCNDKLYKLITIDAENLKLINITSLFKIGIKNVKDLFILEDYLLLRGEKNHTMLSICDFYIDENLSIDYQPHITLDKNENISIHIKSLDYDLKQNEYKNYIINKDNPKHKIVIDWKNNTITNSDTLFSQLINEFVYLPDKTNDIKKTNTVAFYSQKTDILLQSFLDSKNVSINNCYSDSKYLVITTFELESMSLIELSKIISSRTLIITLLEEEEVQNTTNVRFKTNQYLNKLFLFNIVKNDDYMDFVYDKIIEDDQYTMREKYFEIDMNNIFVHTNVYELVIRFIESEKNMNNMLDITKTSNNYKIELLNKLHRKTENSAVIEVLKFILLHNQDITVFSEDNEVDELIFKLNILGNFYRLSDVDTENFIGNKNIIILNNYESFKDWQHLYNKDTMIYILSDNRIIYASLTSS